MASRDPAALHCLGQYYGELARRFARGFDVSLSCDPEAADMMPPRGVFLVAVAEDMPIGCAGLKGRPDGTSAEVKRVWVAPSARGLGLARRMMAVTLERICVRFPDIRLADPEFEPSYEGMFGEIRQCSAPMELGIRPRE